MTPPFSPETTARLVDGLMILGPILLAVMALLFALAQRRRK